MFSLMTSVSSTLSNTTCISVSWYVRVSGCTRDQVDGAEIMNEVCQVVCFDGGKDSIVENVMKIMT